MAQDTELLKTNKQDEEFHRSRLMFCIKDGEVKIAQRGTLKSHFEWFKDEDWITEDNWKNFFNTTIRGYFIPSLNTLYCFKGDDFSFDNEVVETMKKHLANLKEALNLFDDTNICFGPKDANFNNKEYHQMCAGVIKELLKSA